jgi:hypothetical protein
MSWINKILLALLCINVSYAESIIPIFMTNEPVPKHGFDISVAQTPAIRFSPVDNVTLERIELWFGNNSPQANTVHISLHADKRSGKDQSEPGELIEEWTITISSRSWDLKKDTIVSVLQPELSHDERYWIVAQSDAAPTKNPIWGIACGDVDGISIGYYGVSESGSEWQAGYSAIPTASVFGILPTNH